MSTVNYLTARSSNLAAFNTIQLNVSTLTGSTIQTTATANTSSIIVSTLTTRSATYSTLTGSTITSNNLVLSTLTVSSINNGTPGVAAYSTFNASSINATSSITTSSITTSVIATTTGFTTIGQNTSFPNRSIEIGADATNSVYLDFHSSDAALPDYSTRIQSFGGSTIGQGHMMIQASTINILGTSGVGIGTSAPGYKLDVLGDVNFGSNNPTNGSRIYLLGTNACIQGGPSGSDLLHLVSGNGTKALSVAYNGGIGIGLTNPTGKCHIFGAGQSTGTSDVYSLNVSSADSFNGNGGITVFSESINLKAGDLTWNTGTIRVHGSRIYIGGGYSINGAQNQGHISMFTGNVERFRVSDSGLTCNSSSEFTVNCTGSSGPFSIDPNHATNTYIRIWDQLTVTGNFSVTGTKSFSIPHPYPPKRDQGYYLYHSCLETPNAGDTIERFQVSITNDSLHHMITMPDYYYYMCNNVMVLIQSVDTFGRSKYHLERDDATQTVQVHVDVSEAGMYNIIVIGTRCDKEAQRGNFQLEKIHENGVSEIIDRSIKKERECLYCSDCCPDEHPTL